MGDVGLRLGGRRFEDDEFLIMAIVNRTPDCFFDPGATFSEDAALAAVDRAVLDGADIVDIGGVAAGELEHRSLSRRRSAASPVSPARSGHATRIS